MNLRDVMKRLFKDFRSEHANIPDSDFEHIWSQVDRRVESEPPPRIALIGETGVGKTSTLNALFNAGLQISHTRACTEYEEAIEIQLSPTGNIGQNVLVVFDMPGLGESSSTEARHLATYRRVLSQVDVALWILDAQHRAIKVVQDYIRGGIDGLDGALLNRMVIALNKVDLVQPMEWHPLANIPGVDQERHIRSRIDDVRAHVSDVLPQWTGTVIGYSAERRYCLPQLFEAMLDAVPVKRRWVLSSKRALADFMKLVDPALRQMVSRDMPTSADGNQRSRNSPINASDAENDHSSHSDRAELRRSLQHLSPEQYQQVVSSPDALMRWMDGILKDKGV